MTECLCVEWYLLQDNKVSLQLAYEHGHKDVVSCLVKKTADIDPIQINKVLFSKSYAVVDNIPYFIQCLLQKTKKGTLDPFFVPFVSCCMWFDVATYSKIV